MENYYDQLCSNDVIEWVKDLLDKSGWSWRYEDGKIYSQISPGISSTPWHHIKNDHRLNCSLWHQIMFNMVSMRLPENKRFVPSKCQACFKVVVRPKTLKQLFALMELQIKLDIPCKCGIESRDSVHGNYGGYFYNMGMVEGLNCYELVRKAVDEEPRLGTDVEVFLKRACTEFEHACGDSDTWVVTPEQIQMESLVERYVIVENKEIKQPLKLIHRTHRKWIEFAYARGDETYAEYTGGEPLYPRYKTYHHWLEVLKTQGQDDLKIEGQ